MPKQLFSNNASAVLTVGVNTTFTTLTLNDASKFPSPTAGDWFMLALVGLNVNGQEDSWEVVKCTGRSVNVLTVVRAQEGTTGIAWGVGTRAELRVTSAFANQASDHFVNTSNPHTVTATQIGLGNVTNTSDANKPVSTAQQTALNLKADSSSLGTMSTQAATAVNIDGGTIDGTVIGGTTPAAGSFTTLSVSEGLLGASKADVGLNAVDNTSDLNKPISTMQAEINAGFVKLFASPVRMHPSTITENLTIPAGYNASSIGPLGIADGVTVNLDDNSNWSIL